MLALHLVNQAKIAFYLGRVWMTLQCLLEQLYRFRVLSQGDAGACTRSIIGGRLGNCENHRHARHSQPGEIMPRTRQTFDAQFEYALA